jgi:F0F1-type ATP synthase membrane subunit a
VARYGCWLPMYFADWSNCASSENRLLAEDGMFWVWLLEKHLVFVFMAAAVFMLFVLFYFDNRTNIRSPERLLSCLERFVQVCVEN